VAEGIVASGQADMVGMTRAHIADPHVVRKLREGRAEDIRRCIGCMQACLEALANGLPIGCVYNPVTGREGEWATLELAPRSRRGVVVGVRQMELCPLRRHGGRSDSMHPRQRSRPHPPASQCQPRARPCHASRGPRLARTPPGPP
jgi:hypothetical protein